MPRGRVYFGKNKSEQRETRSIRLFPSTKKMIEARYGRVQKFFDKKVEEEFGKEVEVEFEDDRDSITEDDF